MPGIIEEVITLSAGADVLHLDRSFDTGLVATYADHAALDAYNVHPSHPEVVAFGREIAEKDDVCQHKFSSIDKNKV